MLRHKRLDAAAEETAFPEASAGPAVPTDWSLDGRYIAYAHNPGTGFFLDLWALPLFGDRKPFPLVKTAFGELNATFSPDGRSIAFQSNETGESQIYVQSFPVAGRRLNVSKDGGMQPVWRRDGKELFFISADGGMMAAPIDTAGEPEARMPTRLFNVSTNTNPLLSGRHYAVTKDGKRFLVNVIEEASRTMPLTVVVNWVAAVQK
jgi:Tol biopolymer transport system component